MCGFEHECPFLRKNDKSLYCVKFRPIVTSVNITFYCEFSNAVLGHAIRTLPDRDEKTQSYIFTSGSRSVDVPFEWGIYIDMYYRRQFSFDQQTLLKSS